MTSPDKSDPINAPSGGCGAGVGVDCHCVQNILEDGLTSDVSGVDSDGLDFDQHFVLSQFWDGDLLENDVFALALRSSVPEVERLRLTRSSRTSLTRALQASGMFGVKSDMAAVDVAQPRPATSS